MVKIAARGGELDPTQTNHMLKDDLAETRPVVLDQLHVIRYSVLNAIQNWLWKYQTTTFSVAIPYMALQSDHYIAAHTVPGLAKCFNCEHEHTHSQYRATQLQFISFQRKTVSRYLVQSQKHLASRFKNYLLANTLL